ncbi:MAG: hypothetical protein IKY13_04090, partial [Bacteroidaceae bacterium]|nr:hypothetical protein [Bacteroidaceae bacterium]
AFNIKKMARKIAKSNQNDGNNPKNGRFYLFFRFWPPENQIFCNKQKKWKLDQNQILSNIRKEDASF